MPLPLSMMPRRDDREMFDGIEGGYRLQPVGMASIGVVAPERIASGGFVKKPMSCACCCVRVNVAIIIPMPMPQSTHNDAAKKNNRRLPRIGTPKTIRATPSARTMSKRQQEEDRVRPWQG